MPKKIQICFYMHLDRNHRDARTFLFRVLMVLLQPLSARCSDAPPQHPFLFIEISQDSMTECGSRKIPRYWDAP